MSVNGLQAQYIPPTLDGLTIVEADQIYIDGTEIKIDDLIPYTGATRTIDAGSQIIKTAHTAVTNPEVVNLGVLNTTIANLAGAIAGSFLDKVTVTPQTVIGNVSYTAQLSSDDFLVPTTKKASLGSVISVDANWQRAESDATVSTVQYFGSITSSMGIYQATSTQNYSILQVADLGVGIGKRMDINWNLNINEASYNSSIQLFASDNGTTTNQYLGPSVNFTPSDPLYKVMSGTFVPQHRYLCILCATSKPSGVQTVRWYGLDLEEQGVELTNVSMPSLTADRVAVLNGNKQLVSSGISTTKLDYLDNVSGDLQTQLNGKLNLSGSNANQNIVINGYKVQSSATPSTGNDYTNKSYVDTAITGLSSIYAKLAGPQTFTGTHTFSNVSPITLSGLTANRLLGLGVGGDVQAVSVTLLEASYLSGVTSAIQTQINGKASTSYVDTQDNLRVLKAGDTMTGTLGLTSSNIIEFGSGVSGKDGNAGKIGYQAFTTGCLDMVGAGTTSTDRRIRLFDKVGVGQNPDIGIFHIGKTGGDDFFVLNNATNVTGQYINQLFLFGPTTGPNRSAYIQGHVPATNTTELRFFVDSGSGVAERLRVSGEGVNGSVYVNGALGVGVAGTTIDTNLYVVGKGKFHDVNVSAPSNGTNGGPGTRLILWPGDVNSCPYAFGINGGTLWYGTPTTGVHKWYNGTTNVMSLNTGGNLILNDRLLNVVGGTANAVPNGYMAAGSLTLGGTDRNYGGGSFWTSNTAGLLFECQSNTEIAIHDSGDRVASFMYYVGGGFTIGRDTGWGACPASFASNLGVAGNLQVNGTVGIGTASPQGKLHVSLPGSVNDYWGKFIVKTTSFWGDGCSIRSETAGTQYGTIYPMMYMAPHIVSDTDGWCAIRMGRSGGVATGRWWEIANRSDGVFQIGVERSSQFTILPAGDVTIAARLTVGGVNDPNGTLTIRNPNGTNTHFGSSDNFNYIRGDTWMNGVFRCSQTSYWSDWLRISNDNTGIWWEGLGRGIRSADAEGNPYGNIATHGTGRNGWSGYGIKSRWCFMGQDGTNEGGIYDNSHGWVIRAASGVFRQVYMASIARASPSEYDRFIIWRTSENDWGGGYWYFNQAGGWGYTSDERIKKDIAPLSTQQSIAFVRHLQPTTFRMKDTEPCVRTNPDGTETVEEAKGCNCLLQDGFIAQNILEACELTGVSKSVLNNWYGYEEEMKKPEEERKLDKDTILGVNDRPILSHTVNAIKGLMEQLEVARKEIDVLTERNQVLEAHARQLEKDFLDYKIQTEERFNKLATLIASLK